MSGATRPSNDLVEWYPLVVGRVPTPYTEIVVTDVDLTYLLDGVTPDGFDAFLARLTDRAGRIGFPLFMRTGQGSGKHDYVDTCLVPSVADLGQHVFNLVEWSTCVDFVGLPTSTWVLRELLPVEAPFTAFNGMPVAKERRYFAEDGQVFGHHPYWPPHAVEQGKPTDPDWRVLLDGMNHESPDEVAELTRLTELASCVLPGAWSVDWLYVRDAGWTCIDLAHYETSFVWAEHPNAPKNLLPERDGMADVMRAIATDPAGLIRKTVD